jgi:multidrug efflux pump subunit AcrA (membrane-fusion protein)
LILFGAAGLLYVFWYAPSGNKAQETADGSVTFQVSKGDIANSITVYGQVVPKQEYTFTFDGDQVSEILVNVGQRVKPDEVMVKLDSTQKKLAMIRANRELQEAKAEGIPVVIEEKELSYQLAKEEYEDTTIRAPFAGVVTEVNQATKSSEAWSLALINTSELFIQAQVDQLDVPALDTGQKAEAVIEPLPDRTLTVEIVEIGGMAVRSGNSRVVEVKAKLPQPEPSILPGYSAKMDITTASATDVLRVPISSLIKSPRGWMVMKVVDGKPTPQPVAIGVTSDQYAEVKSGLQEGDEVLLYPSVQGQRSGASDDSSEQFERRRSPFQGNTAPSFPGGIP